MTSGRGPGDTSRRTGKDWPRNQAEFKDDCPEELRKTAQKIHEEIGGERCRHTLLEDIYIPLRKHKAHFYYKKKLHYSLAVKLVVNCCLCTRNETLQLLENNQHLTNRTSVSHLLSTPPDHR